MKIFGKEVKVFKKKEKKSSSGSTHFTPDEAQAYWKVIGSYPNLLPYYQLGAKGGSGMPKGMKKDFEGLVKIIEERTKDLDPQSASITAMVSIDPFISRWESSLPQSQQSQAQQSAQPQQQYQGYTGYNPYRR